MELPNVSSASEPVPTSELSSSIGLSWSLSPNSFGSSPCSRSSDAVR
jgi:hypothetical protein